MDNLIILYRDNIKYPIGGLEYTLGLNWNIIY